LPATHTSADLADLLRHLDGRSYKAYGDLRHEDGYLFGAPYPFRLHVDHVQADPFAPPSRLRVCIQRSITGLPTHLLDDPVRCVGLCHGIAEAVAAAMDLVGGSGDRPTLQIDRPGQQILRRSCIQITDDEVSIHFSAQLPANCRRILGHKAADLLCEYLPSVVASGLIYKNLDSQRLESLSTSVADSEAIRAQLAQRGLTAFVADGSRLPRHSGASDEPMTDNLAINADDLAVNIVEWKSPKSVRVQLHLADGRPITGTGFRRGVTVIVGGGFHGKSTLLDALRLGIYAHVPGDGRERVVCDSTAVAIRAEDGRRVSGVDLSPFIGELPHDRYPSHFVSDAASGSTSQAAAIVEALEQSCQLLLIDEDTAATNFMIRDHRMRQLISDDREPITPFIDRVRQLAASGISTILISGGSSDYLGVADTVIAMDNYQPSDVTTRAHELVVPSQQGRTDPWPPGQRRIPKRDSISPLRGRRAASVRARGLREIHVGQDELDLTALSQLVHCSQTRALAQAIEYAHEHLIDGERDVVEICAAIAAKVDEEGLGILAPGHRHPDVAQFRHFELAAALNRLRSLQIASEPGVSD